MSRGPKVDQPAAMPLADQLRIANESRNGLQRVLADCQERLTNITDQLSLRNKQLEETKANNAELKERVAHQVVTIATLRGYIDRVREDDVVNEELLTIGAVEDPCGEKQLVPKRKHVELPNDYSAPQPQMGYADHQRERIMGTSPRPRKNWVNY